MNELRKLLSDIDELIQRSVNELKLIRIDLDAADEFERKMDLYAIEADQEATIQSLWDERMRVETKIRRGV